MHDEYVRNFTHLPQQNLPQYQVHENVHEQSVPERPIREEDEYDVEHSKAPTNYLLPPNQRPLTLQSVMRPGPNKPMNHMRPPFRRPVPPEIKLRRPPPPMYHKNNNGGYPLSMPSQHGHAHGPYSGQYNGPKKAMPPYSNNRMPPNMNRPPMSGPPMKNMPPYHHSKPQMNYGQQKPGAKPFNPNGPIQTIVVGKPVNPNGNLALPPTTQTLNLGQTDIIVNQVVKSQITLPGQSDTIAQPSLQSPSIASKPGQIILGRPMENPMPLDQQMIQTNQHSVIRPPPTPAPENTYSTTTKLHIVQAESEKQQQSGELNSSDFIGESVETSSLAPAVNTGFKPDSIVIESGFKPIIREPLMDRLDEDRITDGINENSNRRQDTDVEEEYDDVPQQVTNHKYPSEKLTQSFEPMFIPSPEDHSLASGEKTKEIFPSNHAKEERPHPVYVPVKSESELNALFSKKNMEKDIPSDMVMESNRVSPQYLPPDPKQKEHSQKIYVNEETYTTYDGKTVSAATLTSIPEIPSALLTSKLPANTELLLKTPQLGPFKGEMPPPVGEAVIKDALEPTLNTKSTHLKLANLEETTTKAHSEDLKPEASENSESEISLKDLFDQFYEDEDEEEEDTRKRHKRETQTTQFEDNKESTTTQKSFTNGHMQHTEYESTSASSSSTIYSTLYLVLATLSLKFVCIK